MSRPPRTRTDREDDLLLGVDIGTSSSKGLLARPDGTVVAVATREHRLSLPRPGWAEMDAEVDWWGDVVALVRELLPRAGGMPAGVCVSGMGPCLVLVDERLRPLGPAVLYGIDSRAAAEVDELELRLGADAVAARGGSALSSQAVGPKLLWSRRHRPEQWAGARSWHGASSFVVARLTGEVAMDHHTASQCNPFYDLAGLAWAQDWAEQELGPELHLPRLVWPAEVVGTVHARAAQETGLAVGTPVCAGTVDAWAEAYGAGVRGPGEVMLMYGSTSFLIEQAPAPQPAPPLWTTTGVEPGTYTLAAGTATAGSLTSWVQELTGGDSFAALVAEAARVPAGAEGLVVLPHFAGERTPVFDPRARGVVAGLTLRHGRGHLYRAALEGIACGVAELLDLFEGAAGPVQRLVAVGGGTRGDLWTQIVSDVTGRAQHLPVETVGACYGDALLAAQGVGLVPAGTDWSRPGRLVVPDEAAGEVYSQVREIARELWPATRGAMHALADLGERTRS